MVAYLRRQMLEGHLPPGAKLPTHAALMDRFAAGADTIQAAMDKLVADGAVVARDKSGSFVSDRPPFLHRYGLVFLQSPHRQRYWSYMYQAFEAAAARVVAGRGGELARYVVDQGDPRHPDHQRLLADVLSHRLAGLIFTMAPYELLDSPIVTSPQMPRVAITEATVRYQMGIVSRALDQFPALAVRTLLQAGRRRAAVTTYFSDLVTLPALQSLLPQAGITSLPHWTFPTDPAGSAVGLRHYLHALLDRPADQRPDSLIVADDNLAESAVAGVRAAGLTPGRDVMIVSLANAPAIPRVDGDVTWIALDNDAILTSCLDQLALMRSNDAIPPKVVHSPRLLRADAA